MSTKHILWGLAFLGVAAGASRLGSVMAPDAQPPGATGAASRKDEPAFQFRRLTVGTSLAAARRSVGLSDCSPVRDGTTTCYFADPRVGSVPLTDSFVFFEPAGFRGFIATTNSDNFDQLVEQLVQAYGAPCEASTRKLQNLMGASFSGDALTWCFKDGFLTLDRHEKSDVRQSALQFYVPSPEKASGPVSPDTL